MIKKIKMELDTKYVLKIQKIKEELNKSESKDLNIEKTIYYIVDNFENQMK